MQTPTDRDLHYKKATSRISDRWQTWTWRLGSFRSQSASAHRGVS